MENDSFHSISIFTFIIQFIYPPMAGVRLKQTKTPHTHTHNSSSYNRNGMENHGDGVHILFPFQTVVVFNYFYKWHTKTKDHTNAWNQYMLLMCLRCYYFCYEKWKTKPLYGTKGTQNGIVLRIFHSWNCCVMLNVIQLI